MDYFCTFLLYSATIPLRRMQHYVCVCRGVGGGRGVYSTWDPSTQSCLAHCPFLFVQICEGSSTFQLFHLRSQCRPISPPLIGPDLSRPYPRPLSFPFPAPDIQTECKPTFLILFQISYIWVFSVALIYSACTVYYRLISPVRSLTNNLQCLLSSLLMNWTYLSVGSSKHVD